MTSNCDGHTLWQGLGIATSEFQNPDKQLQSWLTTYRGNLSNSIVTPSMLDKLMKIVPRLSVAISPESHDTADLVSLVLYAHSKVFGSMAGPADD